MKTDQPELATKRKTNPGLSRISNESQRFSVRRGVNRNWVLGGLVFVFLLTACVVVWARSNSKPVGGQWVQARRGAIPPILRELGYVGARQETRIFSGFTGEVVWKIDEGTQVEPGTVIVRFESEKARDEIERLKQDLYEKEEAVRAAETDLKTTDERYKLENLRLEDELKKVQLDRDLLYAMPKPDDRKQAKLTLETAEVYYEVAVRELESYEILAKEGFATQALLKQKELAKATKKVDLTKAQQLYQLTLNGATTDSKRAADIKVADAEKNLAASKFNRQADRKASEASLELVRIDLDTFKKSLAEKRHNLDEADSKAPVAGRVAFVNVFKGSKNTQSPLQIGETRSRGSDLCKIVDGSQPTVKLLVNEADLPRIKIAQSGIIRLPAFPGRAFKGHVTEIGRVSQDKNMALSLLALQKSGEAFINVCMVTLSFDDVTQEEKSNLKLGYTAEAYIQGLPAPGNTFDPECVLVPFPSVQYDALNKPYVWVSADQRNQERRDVTLGRSDGLSIEILNGVKTGEWVMDLSAIDPSVATSKASGEKAAP